ncbi:MAG: N-acetylmuramoyl-L-alanine amidase [Bacteroidota bacterium]
MTAKFHWILDNGHGNDTPGKRSPVLPDGRQFFEYEFNRAVVSRLKGKLDTAGLQSTILVPEQHDISLPERVRRANSLQSTLPLFFISVHSNAFGNAGFSAPRGIETFYYTGSVKGRALAEVFQKHLLAHTGWKDRKVKEAEFYVIKNSAMPAVLTENGFYTNLEECELLLDDSWREKIASAHFDAILELENTNHL